MNQPKIALVTGATSGVGKAIAIGLSKQQFRVVMLVRNINKGEEIKKQIIAQTGNVNIDLIVADMSSLQSVRNAATEFLTRYNRLDVLSNNAAVLPLQRELTVDGFESIFGVNYLSHFLLTNLLLDVLKKSSSRIINVAGGLSVVQRMALDFDDLQNEKNFNPLFSTLKAALAKTMFSIELSKRLSGTGVTVNAFHPGYIQSELGRNLPWYLKWAYKFGNLFLSKECKTGVYAASSAELIGISGKFISNKKYCEFHSMHMKEQHFSMLWDISSRMVGL